jgi:hypothetical protein
MPLAAKLSLEVRQVADLQTNQFPFSSPIDLQSLIYVQRDIGGGSYVDEKITPQMIIDAAGTSPGGGGGPNNGNLVATFSCGNGATTDRFFNLLWSPFGNNTAYDIYQDGVLFAAGWTESPEDPAAPNISYSSLFALAPLHTYCVIEVGSGLQSRIIPVYRSPCP